MTAPPTGYRRVFFPTDLEAGAEAPYAHAFRLALAGAGDLHVVHVHKPDATPSWDHLPSARDLCVRWGRLAADASVDAYHRLGLRVAFTALPSLELESPIERAVAHDHPDLLVLGTHARKGSERLRAQSVAEDLARRAAMPALFVQQGARSFVDPDSGSVSLRTVIVPADTSTRARRALREAIRLVRSYEAEPCTFVIVHVGDRDDAPYVELPPDDARWDLRYDHREGDVAGQIVAAVEAHDADAVVMTTAGHDSLADWVRGSLTEVVVRHAPCPVLAVPEG
ncbi:MAG: universal stress protein [Myxococcales bacterium]|nr:universal stress protein [Myxococcales bacterium]